MGLKTALFVCTRLVPSCHLHNVEFFNLEGHGLKAFQKLEGCSVKKFYIVLNFRSTKFLGRQAQIF